MTMTPTFEESREDDDEGVEGSDSIGVSAVCRTGLVTASKSFLSNRVHPGAGE